MKLLQLRKRKQTFAIRTVKDGKVKIFGYTFIPKDGEYNGELDGQRFAFGIYYNMYMSEDGQGYPIFVDDKYQMLDTVYLWGTEKVYLAKTEEERHIEWRRQPNHINGEIKWLWWEAIK